MTFEPPRNANPFEAPTAGIGPRAVVDPIETVTDAELIRRQHIGHEASIKSLGLLNYLGAFFGAIGTVGLLAMGLGLIPMNQPNANPDGPSPETLRAIFLGFSLLYLALTALNAGMGYGLRRLQAWARWITVIFTALGLLYTLVISAIAALRNPILGLVCLLTGSLIPGYILYLMVSAKGGMVFSPEYKVIIEKTPQIRYKTSLIVKVFLGLLLFMIILAVIGAIVGLFPPR